MIIKSYQIENNIDTIDKHKFALFYGENNGLKDSEVRILTDRLQSELVKVTPRTPHTPDLVPKTGTSRIKIIKITGYFALE